MAVGDSLAMPAHWYYDTGLLRRTFGRIEGLLDAPKELPGSILNKSNTGGPGRGGFEGDLVGSVILHGKKHFWARDRAIHYHYGLKAGDNTLDLQVMRLLLRGLAAAKGFSQPQFLKDYIAFMTTPDSFKDIYAGSAHRLFFLNLTAGKPPEQCAGNDHHNVDSMDGLTNLPPVLLLHLARGSSPEAAAPDIARCIKATRDSDLLVQYGLRLYRLFQALQESPPERVLEEEARHWQLPLSKAAPDPTVACYI
jgi:hypothetical protein